MNNIEFAVNIINRTVNYKGLRASDDPNFPTNAQIKKAWKILRSAENELINGDIKITRQTENLRFELRAFDKSASQTMLSPSDCIAIRYLAKAISPEAVKNVAY